MEVRGKFVRHIYFECLYGWKFQDLWDNRKVVEMKVVDKFVIGFIRQTVFEFCYSKKIVLLQKK